MYIVYAYQAYNRPYGQTGEAQAIIFKKKIQFCQKMLIFWRNLNRRILVNFVVGAAILLFNCHGTHIFSLSA